MRDDGGRTTMRAAALALWRAQRHRLGGAHAWLIYAALMARFTGFVIGLLLARSAGASAVGLYSTVVNTASSIGAPVGQTLVNNATLMASERTGTAAPDLRGLWRVQAGLTLAIIAAGAPLFAVLIAGALDHGSLALIGRTLLPLAAAAVIVNQFGAPLVAALFHGEGRFRHVARLTAAVSAATLLAAYPAVHFGGLRGALWLLVASALSMWTLLSIDLGARHAAAARAVDAAAGAGAPSARDLVRDAMRRLAQASPAIGGAAVSAMVGWLCTIYLINAAWGTRGVGVLAIGLQWFTLMLIPVTSWGGLTLKRVGDAHRDGAVQPLRVAVRRLLWRNVSATAVMAAAVVLAAQWLARLYALEQTELPLLLWFYAGTAVVTSVNNVLERFWWVAGRQGTWFVWSLAAQACQLGFTAAMVHRHLAYAALGTGLGALCLALLGAGALPRYMLRLDGEVKCATI